MGVIEPGTIEILLVIISISSLTGSGFDNIECDCLPDSGTGSGSFTSGGHVTQALSRRYLKQGRVANTPRNLPSEIAYGFTRLNTGRRRREAGDRAKSARKGMEALADGVSVMLVADDGLP